MKAATLIKFRSRRALLAGVAAAVLLATSLAQLSSAEAQPGTRLRLALIDADQSVWVGGRHFGSNERVAVVGTFGTSKVTASVMTSPRGRFSTRLALPAGFSGQASVTAEGAVASARAAIVIGRPPATTTTTGAPRPSTTTSTAPSRPSTTVVRPTTTTVPGRPTTTTSSVPVSGAIPTSWRRSASFETDLGGGTDGWNLPPMSQVSGFSISRTNEVGAASGAYAAKIVSTGGNGGCSCPRMKFEDFRYGAGQDVWIRGSWYFTNPSAVSWSRLMNLSSFTGGSNDYLTGLIVDDAGKMLVATRRYHSMTGAKTLSPSLAIPANRWFTVHLHMKLSPMDGQALTELYVDGKKVSTSTLANMATPQAMNVYQGGMPYFLDGIRSTVYFDNAGLKD